MAIFGKEIFFVTVIYDVMWYLSYLHKYSFLTIILLITLVARLLHYFPFL